MKDTAEEVANLDELIHSAINRLEAARFLIQNGRVEWAITSLEDLFYGVQMIIDEYCIK